MRTVSSGWWYSAFRASFTVFWRSMLSRVESNRKHRCGETRAKLNLSSLIYLSIYLLLLDFGVLGNCVCLKWVSGLLIKRRKGFLAPGEEDGLEGFHKAIFNGESFPAVWSVDAFRQLIFRHLALGVEKQYGASDLYTWRWFLRLGTGPHFTDRQCVNPRWTRAPELRTAVVLYLFYFVSLNYWSFFFLVKIKHTRVTPCF